MKDDSNDTKNETEKRILSFFLIGQSFLKIFAGAGAKLAGRRLALKELKVFPIISPQLRFTCCFMLFH